MNYPANKCCANCNHACRHELWGHVFYSCKFNIGSVNTVLPGHCCDDWTGVMSDEDLGLTMDIWY